MNAYYILLNYVLKSNIIFPKLCSTLSIDNKHTYLAVKLRLGVNVLTSFCL